MWTHENVDVVFPTSIVEICHEDRRSGSEYSDLFLEGVDIGYVDCNEYTVIKEGNTNGK